MAIFSVSTFIDKVVIALKAANANTLAGVKIYDGPEIGVRYTGEAIAVGHDGNLDGDVFAASGQNEYLSFGAQSLQEEGTVECAIYSFSGTSTLKVLRDRGYVLLAAVNTIILTDNTFSSSVVFSGIKSHSLTYVYVENRIGVKISFSIFYQGLT